jgi:hypothetical protein
MFKIQVLFCFGLLVNGTTNFTMFRSGGVENDPTSKYAFHNSPGWGPTFGYNVQGVDVLITSNANVYDSGTRAQLGNSYESPGNLY